MSPQSSQGEDTSQCMGQSKGVFTPWEQQISGVPTPTPTSDLHLPWAPECNAHICPGFAELPCMPCDTPTGCLRPKQVSSSPTIKT